MSNNETDEQIVERLRQEAEGPVDDPGTVKRETREVTVNGQGNSLGLVDGWAVNLAGMGKEQHLIDGVLEQRAISWLVGPSGSYKTFIALSLAAAIASGQEWYGRETLRAPVVYVCAEGERGWEKRMAAYTQVYGAPSDPELFYMRPAPLIIGSPEWTTLHTLCASLQPGLVVIDTQAQCSNAEENSNTEMSEVIRHLTAMAQNLGAHVMTVHHSGHGGDGRSIRGRGASAVYAAADTELTVTPKDDDADGAKLRYVDLSATKQKDMETGPVVTLAPHPVDIDGAADWRGRPISSVVMKEFTPSQESQDAEGSPTPAQWARRLIRAGVDTPAKNRDVLYERAEKAGVKGLPMSPKSLQPVQTAHKQMTQGNTAPPLGEVDPE